MERDNDIPLLITEKNIYPELTQREPQLTRRERLSLLNRLDRVNINIVTKCDLMYNLNLIYHSMTSYSSYSVIDIEERRKFLEGSISEDYYWIVVNTKKPVSYILVACKRFITSSFQYSG